MGEGSRLLKILQQDKDALGEVQNDDETENCGVPRIFQRVGKSLRGSFRKLKKEIKKKKAVVGDQDDTESEFHPSGRDSAYFSLNLSLGEEEDGETTCSSIDNGKCSPLTNTRKHEPKRAVVLKQSQTPEKPFGVHLQGPLKVKEYRIARTSSDFKNDLADQISWLQDGAKHSVLKMFPHLKETVIMLFHPQPLSVLATLTSNQVASLLLGLHELLHSSLLISCSWSDIILCASIALLYSISCLTSNVTGLAMMPSTLLRLQEQCARFYYTSPYTYWTETRILFLHIWNLLIIS